MTQAKLGLPLEYRKFPQYFNATNVHDKTDAQNAVIENLLARYQAKTVLDLTCGTGSQVFFLAQHGYQCTGADFSPALLEIARERARKQKIAVQFLDGDMRIIKVGIFDAVITIFNAVGHLTKTGFAKAISNIRRNLKEGGIYIFDILNLEAMTDARVAGLSYHTHKKVHDTQLHVTQCSTLDRSTGILTSYDCHMIHQNAGKPEIFKSKFCLQIYTAKELQTMLTHHGFKTVAQYDMYGADFVKEQSLSILTVARKV